MSCYTTRTNKTTYVVRFSWLDIATGRLRRLLHWYENDGWSRSHIVETPNTTQRFSYYLTKG